MAAVWTKSQVSVAGRFFGTHKVRDGVQTYVVERDGKEWTCDCPSRGECTHERAVMVVACKANVRPISGVQTAASLAASGAVTVKWHEPPVRSSADVVDLDNGESFRVARERFGGGHCGCGAPNADCVHGAALRFVLEQS
jgi:hypothetical protein